MRNIPFDLENLILLRNIIKYGSFKKASVQLGISQPAITFRIKNLEKKLGLFVFKRNRPISLTETGLVLYKYSEKILFLCEEVSKTLNDFKLPKEILLVGASQTIGTYIMPQILGLFKKRYSEINIILEIHSSRKISWFVANGLIDFAIIGGDIPKELKNVLEVIPYAEDELALILPYNHPLCNQNVIKKEDLYRINFLVLNKNSTIRKVIDKILEKNGIDTNRFFISMELNSIEAIKNAVNLGLGAAFISISAITKELNQKTIKKINIENVEIKRKLSLLINPNRHKTKAFEIFSNEMSDLIKELPIKKFKNLLPGFITI